MPLTSASPLSNRLATVFDFLPALARRRFAARLGSRGSVRVISGSDGVLTLAHQYRASGGSELVEQRFAQLRGSRGAGDYQLFWKKGNGRWTAYCGGGSDPFVGSIDECLREIARDPFGCYWS
jgi:hypothetical protein